MERGPDTWLVMDYAPNGTLATHLAAAPRRRLALGAARLAAAEVAAGLLALHGASVVHRDIKPGNILVDHQGHCLIADLGLAASGKDHLRRLCGTLEYLAPEQLRGKRYGRGVDLWALGCLLFESLAGYETPASRETRLS